MHVLTTGEDLPGIQDAFKFFDSTVFKNRSAQSSVGPSAPTNTTGAEGVLARLASISLATDPLTSASNESASARDDSPPIDTIGILFFFNGSPSHIYSSSLEHPKEYPTDHPSRSWTTLCRSGSWHPSTQNYWEAHSAHCSAE